MEFNKYKCTGCGTCVETCPCDAITLSNGVPQVDKDKCCECGSCISRCPFGAIENN